MASILQEGERLRWHSPTLQNGEYELVLQQTGNLEVKHNSTVIWETNTKSNDPTDRAYYATLQNGNLRLSTVANETVWQTNTSGHGGAVLRLFVDGNLVISHWSDGFLWWSRYKPEGPPTVEVPWAREEDISYARHLIESANLEVDFFGDCSGRGRPSGEAWVRNQSPAPGQRVRPGTTVRCECSSEEKP
jgi:hypothetical protein